MSEHHPHPNEAPPAQSSGYAEQAEYGEAASHAHHDYSPQSPQQEPPQQQAPQQQGNAGPPPLPPDPWLDGPSMTNLEVMSDQAPPAPQPDSDDSSWLPAAAPQPSWLPDAPYGSGPQSAQPAPPQQAQPLPPGVPIAPNGAPVPFSVDADWTQAPVLPSPGDQEPYPHAQPTPANTGANEEPQGAGQQPAPSDSSADGGPPDDQDWASVQQSSGITPLPEQPAEPESAPYDQRGGYQAGERDDHQADQSQPEFAPTPSGGYLPPESFVEQSNAGQPQADQQLAGQSYGEQPRADQQFPGQSYGDQPRADQLPEQSYGEQPYGDSQSDPGQPQIPGRPYADDQSYSTPQAFPSSQQFPLPEQFQRPNAFPQSEPFPQPPTNESPAQQPDAYGQPPYPQQLPPESAPQGYPQQGPPQEPYQQGPPQQSYQQSRPQESYEQGRPQPEPSQQAPQQQAPQGQRRHGAEQQSAQRPQQFGPQGGFDQQSFGGQNAAAQGFSGPLAPSSAADLSTSTLIKSKADVPSSGWRRVVFKATAGALNPGLSKDELHRQSQIDRIRTPVRGCHRIAVVSLKGGIGKTTTTSGLGLTLAHYRGDRVVALDANPDAGTLAERLTGHIETSVRNLLDNYDSIQSFTDVSRYMSLAERLQVIASDQDPEVSEAFDAEQYKLVCDLLARFYNVVLTDSGTGMLHSAMAGTLQMADSLVVVGAPSVDGASRAAKTLDWLIAHGHDDLVRRSVAVISSVREKSGDVDMDVLRNHFGSRCRAVVEIPYDPHLVIGGLIDMQQIRPATTNAYLELAATVADGFAQT